MHDHVPQHPPELPTHALNPYASPTASTRAVPMPWVLAGRGERLLAVLLDAFAYAIGFVPMFVVAIIYSERDDPPPAFYFAALIGGAIWLAVFVYNLVLLQRQGQTIGKQCLRLRIVRADGSRADLGRIFGLRMLIPGLIGGVPCIGFLFSLADALAIFGEDRRCLHDLFADTIVVVA